MKEEEEDIIDNETETRRANGTFKMGHGRPVGSKNKITQIARACFAELLNNNLPDMQRWIDEVAIDSPKDAVDLILKISEFVIPKLARQETVITVEEKVSQVTIEIVGEDVTEQGAIDGKPEEPNKNKQI